MAKKFSFKAVVEFKNCGSNTHSSKFAKTEVEATQKLHKLIKEVLANEYNVIEKMYVIELCK